MAIELPEPVARMFRGGLGGRWGRANILQEWLPASKGLPNGEYDLHTASQMREHEARAFEEAAQLIERYPHWLGENAKREIAKALRSLIDKGGEASHG